MSPQPAAKHDDTRDPKHPYDSLCGCNRCERSELRAYKRGYAQDPPRMAWRGPLVLLSVMLITAVMVCSLLYLAFGDTKAHAREGAIHPVPIPAAHARARATCPLDKPLICRAALIHAYEAIAWAKKERTHRWAPTVEMAIQLACASQPAMDCDWFRRMIRCESGRDPLSKNRHSTAAGLAQFLDGTWSGNLYHRFSVYNPLANALGAAWLAARNGHGPWYSSRGCWE